MLIGDYSRHEMQQDEPQEMIWPDPPVIARAVERLPDGYRVVSVSTCLKDMITLRFHRYWGSRNQPQKHSIRGQRKNLKDTLRNAKRWMNLRNI